MVALCCVRVSDAVIVCENSVERRCCECKKPVWASRASIAQAERNSKGEGIVFFCIQCVNVDESTKVIPMSEEQAKEVESAVKNKPN